MRYALFLAIFISFISVLAIPSLAVTNYIYGFSTTTMALPLAIDYSNDKIAIMSWANYTGAGDYIQIKVLNATTGSTISTCSANNTFYYGMQMVKNGNGFIVVDPDTNIKNLLSNCGVNASFNTGITFTIFDRFGDAINNTDNIIFRQPLIAIHPSAPSIQKVIYYSSGIATNSTLLIPTGNNYKTAGYSNDNTYVHHVNNFFINHYNSTTGDAINMNFNMSEFYGFNESYHGLLIAPYENHSTTHKYTWLGYWATPDYFNDTNTLNLYLVYLETGLVAGSNYTYGNTTLPENPTLTQITGYYLSGLLGISNTGALTFISLLLSVIAMIIVTGYLGLKGVNHAFLIGIMVFIVFISIFTLSLAWLSTWVFGALVILFGALAFGMLTGKISGGG